MPEQHGRVMVQFVQGELDVLVATTIVESGLDIPRANTMFVARERASTVSDRRMSHDA